MRPRRVSYALRCSVLLLLLFVSFANLPVTVHAGSSDLIVDSIWLEDASQPGQSISQVSPGQSFLIVAAIKNIGQDAAPSFYLDVYYDSDYGRGGPDNILAGETQTWYVGPLTAQDGTHTTRWVVDPDNLIAELDESNNQEYTFTIGQQTTTTTTTAAVETSTATSSQTVPPTLTLTPTSGGAGTFVTASGLNYQGLTCLLAAAPSTLFNSQRCSIVAGVLTGSFTVDSNAPAGDYAVTVQTNAGQSDSATSSFTIIPSYTVTFYTDPNSATVTVDGASKADGTIGTYASGQRAHVVANAPSGYSFVSWEASGVSVDGAASADTFITVSGNGWLKAHFAGGSSPTGIHPIIRGTDNRVYYAADLSGTSIALPGKTSDSPAACVCGGTLHIAIRGPNSVIYYGYVLLSTNAFSGWTKLPGSTASAPALAAASDCSLYLVVRGKDNGIYLSAQPSGRSWSGWRKLPGATIDAPAAAVAGSILHLAVRGSDGSSIHHGKMDLGSGAWLGWIRVSGSTASKPALAAVSDTEVYLAVRGTNNRIYVNKWNSAVWSGWSQIPTGSTPNAPSIAAADGQLYVAVLGTDSRIYRCSRPLPSGSWSSWAKLPGSTPSSPTLA